MTPPEEELPRGGTVSTNLVPDTRYVTPKVRSAPGWASLLFVPHNILFLKFREPCTAREGTAFLSCRLSCVSLWSLFLEALLVSAFKASRLSLSRSLMNFCAPMSRQKRKTTAYLRKNYSPRAPWLVAAHCLQSTSQRHVQWVESGGLSRRAWQRMGEQSNSFPPR